MLSGGKLRLDAGLKDPRASLVLCVIVERRREEKEENSLIAAIPGRAIAV